MTACRIHHKPANWREFDLESRPPGYGIEGPRRPLGTLRRALAADGHDDPFTTAHSLARPARDTIQRFHPALRSGEDLPEEEPDEIEIARWWYTRTVHCEVTSLRARRSRGMYHYEVVDEYGADFELRITRSRLPLTLRRVIQLIDSASALEYDHAPGGLIFGDLGFRLQQDGGGPEACSRLLGFIAVDSDHYPELGDWYRAAIDDWLEKQEALSARARC